MSAAYYKHAKLPTFWKLDDNSIFNRRPHQHEWKESQLPESAVSMCILMGHLIPATAEEAEPPTPEATRG